MTPAELATQSKVPEVKSVHHLEQQQPPTLDRRFIKEIEGKEFVLYAGLLDMAHQMGLERIKVQILQFPSADNGMTCIVQAAAESNGFQFMDIGDANATNCNAKVAKHMIRMASTRAKARCLRDYTNIGMTCLEELADFSEATENGGSTVTAPKRRGRPRKVDTAARNEPKTQEVKTAAHSSASTPASQPQRIPQAPKMSDAQRRAILNLSSRRKMSEEELNTLTQQTHGNPFDSLTSSQASQMIRDLQKAA